MNAFAGKYIHAALIFISVLTVTSVFAVIDVDPHHQGIMLKPAVDVAHGEMLFRDTFTQYGALTTLMHASALRVFGDRLVVIQLQTALFYGLISLCLWFLWIRILPQWLSTVSVGIWLFLAPFYIWPFIPWSSVPALFFQLLSLILLLNALRSQKAYKTVLAGAVAVLVFWCRQPVGFFHCGAMLVFVASIPLVSRREWSRTAKDSVLLMCGMMAGSAPFLLWLAFYGALDDMYVQSIKAAIFFGTQVDHGAGSSSKIMVVLGSLAGYHPWFFDYTPLWTILPIVTVLLVVVVAVRAWRGRSEEGCDLDLYGLLLIALASWLQYHPRADVRHCFWAAAPMIGLFSFAAWISLARTRSTVRVVGVCLILFLVFGFDVSYRAYSGLHKLTKVYVKMEEPPILRGMYTTTEKMETYREISHALNKAIESNTSHYLVNLTNDAMYSTFVGYQPNYHPMYVDWGAYNDFVYSDFKERRQNFLTDKRPLLLGSQSTVIPETEWMNVFGATSFGANERLVLFRFAGSDEESKLFPPTPWSGPPPPVFVHHAFAVNESILVWRTFLSFFDPGRFFAKTVTGVRP